MAKAVPTGVALVLFAATGVASVADSVPGDRECERGKGIERDLGERGYRVVVSGGYDGDAERPVKVQIWENPVEHWVITERFMQENRTCVIRSGRRLHMLY